MSATPKIFNIENSFRDELTAARETLLNGMTPEGGAASRASFERLVGSSFVSGALWLALQVNGCLAGFAEEFPNCLCDKDGAGNHSPLCPMERLRLAAREVSDAAKDHFHA